MSLFSKLTSKQRGTVTTLVSGALGNALHLIFLQTGLGQTGAFVLFVIIGNIITYSLDILFAKRVFHIAHGFAGQVPYTGSIPYHDLITRAQWLIKSFVSLHFFRFSITILVDLIISLSLIDFLKKFCDARDIHFWARDFIIATVVPAFTFLLFLNILRFDWAYSEKASPIMNVMVLLWVSVVILIFVLNTNVNKLSQMQPT